MKYILNIVSILIIVYVLMVAVTASCVMQYAPAECRASVVGGIVYKSINAVL